MELDRIIVGVDGSANSVAALEWATALAARTGAEVIAVHALGLLGDLHGERVPAQQHRAEITETFETEWCAPLDRAGVSCRRVVRDGNPVTAVLAAADEVGGDLIVVGTRGVGDHPERLLGSTSTRLAQCARTPVVIVPPPDRSDVPCEVAEG